MKKVEKSYHKIITKINTYGNSNFDAVQRGMI